MHLAVKHCQFRTSKIISARPIDRREFSLTHKFWRFDVHGVQCRPVSALGPFPDQCDRDVLNIRAFFRTRVRHGHRQQVRRHQLNSKLLK